MTNKSVIGRLGEDIACEFLIKKNYKILKRNYWKPWGELDIIAKDRDGVLVFIEVKAMRCLALNTGLQPEDNLTNAKLKKLKRIAASFAGSNAAIIDPAKGYRIDLVTVIVETGETKHYENI
ncbi:MAG: YraN family protein [bacterium]|nr:YraN family protein [bacterium]